jgi:hypothetical protein
VGFRGGDTAANVWCALFAHQALDWRCDRRGDRGSPAPDRGSLI